MKATEVVFCPDLQKILEEEIKNGNVLSQYPYYSKWPHEESVFGVLEDNFTIDIVNLSDNLIYTVCNDIHYGWYADIYCTKHKDCLAAGKLKLKK